MSTKGIKFKKGTGADDQLITTEGDGSLEVKAGGDGKLKLGAAGVEFPDADGGTDQHLKTDGSGELYWGDGTTGGGETNTASSLGGDQGVVSAKVGQNLPFKGLTAGTGITLSSDSDSITIETSTGFGSSTIAGLSDTDITTPAGANLLVYDGTNSWDNVTASGDVTIAADGAVTIATDAVENSMVAEGAIGNLEVSTNASIDASKIASGYPATNLSGSIPNSQLANDSITITAGDGLAGTGTPALGGNVTLYAKVDDTTIETFNDSLRVKTSGINLNDLGTPDGQVDFGTQAIEKASLVNMVEGAAPSEPDTGTGHVYAQASDHKLYYKDEFSTVHDLTKPGTVTSIDVSGGTTGLTTSGGAVTASGTITIDGIVAIAHGGTGEDTAQEAIDSISGVGDASIDTGDVLTKASDGKAKWETTPKDWTVTAGTMHPTSSSGSQTVVVGGNSTSNSDHVFNADGSVLLNAQKLGTGSFKVAGDNDADLIYANAATDKVGIGMTPTEKLEVDGSVKATSFLGDGASLTGITSEWTAVESYEDGAGTGDIETLRTTDVDMQYVVIGGDNNETAPVMLSAQGDITASGTLSGYTVSASQGTGQDTGFGFAEVNHDIAGVQYTAFNKTLDLNSAKDTEINLNTGAGETAGKLLVKSGSTSLLDLDSDGDAVFTGDVTADSFIGSGTTLTGVSLSGHNHTLNSLTVPDGDVSLNSKKITGLAAPVSGTDASNKTYVDTAVAGIVDSAPATLDTLNELAASLNDDASFATTMTTSLAGKSATGHDHDSAYAAKASGSTAANEIHCADNESTDEDCNIVFVDGATGAQGAETDGDLTYNPSTGKVTATKFAGDGSLLTGIGASLTVKETSGSPITDVSTIKFDDVASGLTVTNEGDGVVEIGLGSHWKELEVEGASNLIPSGEEDLAILKGDNITFSTNTSSDPKQLTIGTTGLAAAVHTHPASAVEAASGDNTKVLTVTGGAAGWADAPGGTTTFTGLTDTPASLSGQGGKSVAVNSGGTALELVDAGSGSNWTDSPDEASLDGVVALEKQSSIPSAGADFAKIYSKEVSVSGTSTGHILLRGDTGSSAIYNSGSLGTDCTISQQGYSSYSSIVTDSFTDSYDETTGVLKFPEPSSKYMKIMPGNHSLELDGEFCIDWWWHAGNQSDRSFFFSWQSTNSSTTVYDGNGTNIMLGAFVNGTQLAYNYTGFSNKNAWVHLALTRDSSDLCRFYVNGTSVGSAINSGVSTPHSTHGITLWKSSGSGSIDMAGYINDFRILFGSTGGMEGSSFDLPDIGHGLSTGSQTHMFAMDGAGNEYQLTKAYSPV